MAIGDGVRRNVAAISPAERDRLRDAIIQLKTAKSFPDGVSYWDKQDEIHGATHVHAFFPWRGIAFLPWHREICNRFESLLREVDPELSLHYWDWTTDPRVSPDGAGGAVNLFATGANGFMGSSAGSAGPPLQGFPVTRQLQAGAPSVPSDLTIYTTGDGFPVHEQYRRMRNALEGAHNGVHSYIGGTIGDPHSSFKDPFVFLLHSNVDRLFAMWQRAPGKAWRLDPGLVYGDESGTDTLPSPAIYDPGILTPIDPWAGNPRNDSRITAIRPWAPPDNQQQVKDYRHVSVVTPPLYDTSPERVWDLIGHANDVVGMTAINNKLFCATSDNRLWWRDPVGHDVDWDHIGHANNVVGMTAINNKLFCATWDNRLWWRDPVGHDVDWDHIGHANDVVDMAAVNNKLFCATRDNRLWWRDPVI
jgi:hypothetical protein